MKAPTGKLAFAYRTIAELEGERDALAQRCRELEHMLKHARIDADTHYADTLTLRAEVERLNAVLDQRNAECDRLIVEGEHLRKDAARIEWLASQARMIYGRKGEARYQLEELPEPIQSDREECRPDDLRRSIDEAMEAAE